MNDYVESKNYLFKMIVLYIAIALYLIFILLILFASNGGFRVIVESHLTLFLSPLIIPIIFSFVGVDRFIYSNKNGIVFLKSSCILFGNIIENQQKSIEVHRHHIKSIVFETFYFGLKKKMFLTISNGKKKTKISFNVSMLSKDEFDKLNLLVLNINH